MFQEVIQRAEKLMVRTKDVQHIESLSKKDNDEAIFIVEKILYYTEKQSSFPQRMGEEIITEDEINKATLYYAWYESMKYSRQQYLH